MPEQPRKKLVGAGVFPAADHFPLGRAYGRVDTVPEPASAVRLFGLTLAVSPNSVTCVDPAKLSYDEDRQVGLIRDGADMDPAMSSQPRSRQNGAPTRT
jgi:hypothetical protein